jgi:hypothetical protein
LVDVFEVRRLLRGIAWELSKLADMPQFELLTSKEVLEVTEKLHRDASMLYKSRDASLIPVFYYAFLELSETVYHLYRFITEIQTLCDVAKRFSIMATPDPCDLHTLNSDVEQVIRDFRRKSKMMRMYRELAPSDVESIGRAFLESLRYSSFACSLATEGTCLTYASPVKVTPASLRTYIQDLSTATNLLIEKLNDLYYGVEKWVVGLIQLYEHPSTTRELSDLAEYAANILHKEAELSVDIRERIATRATVFSLKDRVAVGMREFGSVVVKPRWVVEVYGYDFMLRALLGNPRYATPIDALKDVLDERGFKTKFTSYGLEVTIPPGDVMEAVKTVLALPLMPQSAASKESLYFTLTANIKSLERKLKEQEPIKKQKHKKSL